MANFCSNCGSPLSPNSKFCSSCGQKVAAAEIDDLAAANKAQPVANAASVQVAQQKIEQPAPSAPAAAKASPTAAPQDSYINDDLQGALAKAQAKAKVETKQNAKGNTFKEKYFSFDGRLNRQTYIVRGLLLLLIGFVMALAFGLVIGIFSNDPTGKSAESIGNLVGIVIGLMSLSLTVRRCHDLDKSGWWALLCLIPFVNIIFSIYLLFFKGTDGANRYGEDPLRYK